MTLAHVPISRLIALAAALAGCAALQPPGSPGRQSERPDSAPAGVRGNMLVSGAWLTEHLADANLVILHIGRSAKPGEPAGADRREYDAAHLPGAQFVPLSRLATTRGDLPNELPSLSELTTLVRELGITPASRVILYDDQAGLWAARAYIAFDYLGLGGQTALLDGQWRRWKTEGRPISFLPTSQPTPSRLSPRPRPEVVIALSAMRELVEAHAQPDAPISVIDARPSEQYCGLESGEGISRAGHVPGAANVFWLRNIVSEDNPTFRPPTELRAIYRSAGIQPGDLVVTYCRTGVQAAHAYFVLKYLGYDVRLYDGSFWEWSRSPTAVVRPGATSQPG